MAWCAVGIPHWDVGTQYTDHWAPQEGAHKAMFGTFKAPSESHHGMREDNTVHVTLMPGRRCPQEQVWKPTGMADRNFKEPSSP